MEPNVDRGMWSVVALLAAIVIGGVVLIAFPRISGKIANSMDDTVNKAFNGETPEWVKGEGDGLKVVKPKQNERIADNVFKRSKELVVNDGVVVHKDVNKNLSSSLIIDVREMNLLKVGLNKRLNENSKTKLPVRIIAVDENANYKKDVNPEYIPLMPVIKGYDVSSYDFIMIEVPEYSSNWSFVLSDELFEFKENLLIGDIKNSNDYRTITKIDSEVYEIVSHRGGTSPVKLTRLNNVKKGDTYTLSGKFKIVSGNGQNYNQVPMLSMLNFINDDGNNFIHRNTATIKDLGEWVEVSVTHTFDQDYDKIEVFLYGGHREGNVSQVKHMKLEKSDYQTEFAGYKN